VFSFAGDLGVKWKHNAWLTFANDDFAITLTQIFRNGYANQKLPGIANGSVTRPGFNERVNNYVIYNLSASLLSLTPGYKLTVGVKNIFDKTYYTSSIGNSTYGIAVGEPFNAALSLRVKY